MEALVTEHATWWQINISSPVGSTMAQFRTFQVGCISQFIEGHHACSIQSSPPLFIRKRINSWWPHHNPEGNKNQERSLLVLFLLYKWGCWTKTIGRLLVSLFWVGAAEQASGRCCFCSKRCKQKSSRPLVRNYWDVKRHYSPLSWASSNCPPN